MFVVIGSVAMRRFVDPNRVSRDLDVVGIYDEVVDYMKISKCTSIVPIDNGKKVVGRNFDRIIEAEIAWDGSSSQELIDLVANDPLSKLGEFKGFQLLFPSLDMLYLLKMSHRFRKNSPHFLKTMRDIHLLRGAGAVIRDEHKAFFERRFSEVMDYAHPKLNQKKVEFFTDSVPYVYDHDSIHIAVALNKNPAYTYYKDDQSEVKCSRKKFFDISEDIRLAGVYEESCVLALERSVIPYPNSDKQKAFEFALMKVCTSITSGWFREFAWENYDKVLNLQQLQTLSDKDYVDQFKRGLASGLVKPYLTGTENA